VGRGWIAAGFLAALAAGIAALVYFGSSVRLASDPGALARVKVGLLGGKVESAEVLGPDGHVIPASFRDGRVTPRQGLIAPGERVTVQVAVRRPGATAWLLGSQKRQRLALAAPAAHLSKHRLTVARGSALRIAFDQPVDSVAYGASRAAPVRHVARGTRSVPVVRHAVAGTLAVASAARPWERLGRPERLTWFPASRGAALVASPAPGAKLTPTTTLRLSFSKPVDDALGSGRPGISPATPGRWRKLDDYTLGFTPAGAGLPLGAHVRVRLPRAAALVGANGAVHRTNSLDWTVPPGSTLRLHQLLASLGYLPLEWRAAGAAVARTEAAQVSAAVKPPKGGFSWRYPNVPGELRGMWQPGHPNDITRGAIMKFQNRHGLQADGFAGPQLWHALLADAVANKRIGGGYSYVYVHRESSPQSLTLWHNGHNVITSPGNTGVASAPTDLGTYPVFEHLPVTTMSGTNPDGSHYSDPGIKWVSYFNGGDAVHAFNRSTFGTPQSVGCVELPAASAAKVYPYMPIGTLVTIEH
jgi:L,D-transpeptidase catalytic domain